MNQLVVICAFLPFGIQAQTMPPIPQMTVSECLPNQFIQIKTHPPGQPVKIYRKANGETHFRHIGNTHLKDGLLHDRSRPARSGQVCTYRFQLPNGQWAPEIQGYVCLPNEAVAIVPYQPLDRTSQNIDFQWSALQEAQKYQLQVSRKEDKASLVSGFSPENVLLDTLLSTNHFNWQSDSKLGDTLYWSVKPVLESKGSSTFFIKPIAIELNAQPKFASATQSLNLAKLALNPDNATIQITNNTQVVLNDIKLHYFVSDTNVFTLQARLLTTQFVETIAPTQSKTIKQPLRLKGLKGYLLIMSSVNGKFLEPQVAFQPIR